MCMHSEIVLRLCAVHVCGNTSRPASELLAIFLGSLGVHRFYLGYTGIGILMLLSGTILAIFTCGISAVAVGVWGIVDGILCFTGSMSDAEGRPLAP